MLLRASWVLCTLAIAAAAQTPCQPVPAYSPCEIVFELDAKELAAHPNPYLTVNLHAELRSPRHKTIPMAAFWDGGTRMIIRFAPTGEGTWDFRITSNLQRFNGAQGQVIATASEHPGFIHPANGHHWKTTQSAKGHLWMGETRYDFAWMPAEEFARLLSARSEQKFTHLRGYAIGRGDRATWKSPDQPDFAFYKTLDERVAAINAKGMIADLILGQDQDHLRKEFHSAAQRERYVKYMVSRYSAYNVTWQIAQEYEEYTDARALMRQLGTVLKATDPYGHPRTTHTLSTSSPLLNDGWMDHILYQSSNEDLGAIEHQIYAAPSVNVEFDAQDKVDSATFRHRLWNSTMNGQYPTFGASGDKAMNIWYDFMATTRYWELEPYFDVDGGRALALPGTEYIVYIEKPSGPVEVRLEKHGYDVKWVDPATGAITVAKDFKAERQSFEPPDSSHDWILHISREGRKEGMLRSWKFESRPFLMQEVETGTTKLPYEIAQPSSDQLSPTVPPRYEAKLKRETRGTRNMLYLWLGESPSNEQGARVLGTGSQGTWKFDTALTQNGPSVMNVRLYGMNANGKVYALDRIYRWAR
jgi:hypothetical protein